MPDVRCNLVVSLYLKDKNNRYFVSSTDDHYTSLSFFLDLNKDISFTSMEEHLNTFLYNHIEQNTITSLAKYVPYYNLLGVKINGSILDINYATMLPMDTKMKNAFLISPNLAIIDPTVRKAMAYV